ncbi:MAG TPA: chemotaxis protein, partial [Streptomyces sp.]
MHAPLSPSTLTDLRRPRHYPAVSVLMPTHRREPDNAQDAVRLRNLLAEAKDAVRSDPEVSRADRIDVVGQLDQAMSEVDLVHAEDGLAIFAAPGEHQVWTVDREVTPRVVL